MNKIEDLLNLSEEILENIEKSNISFQQICLKVSRLSRLLWDNNAFKWIKFEINWYPLDYNWKFTPEAHFISSKFSNRSYFDKILKWNYIFTETIPEIESKIESAKLELSVAIDPNVSISSANPSQYIMHPIWNWVRRIKLNDEIVDFSEKLSKIKHSIYKYVLDKNYELKYWNSVYNIFDNLHKFTLQKIETINKDSLKILSSIYDNLNSSNPIDWTNAVHNCRRVLHDISDILSPYNPERKEKIIWKKTIELWKDKYINRLIDFIETKSKSENFEKIVWSNLKYIWERLDSIYSASNKWSHKNDISKSEAERYIIYTFMLLNDLLSL